MIITYSYPINFIELKISAYFHLLKVFYHFNQMILFNLIFLF